MTTRSETDRSKTTPEPRERAGAAALAVATITALLLLLVPLLPPPFVKAHLWGFAQLTGLSWPARALLALFALAAAHPVAARAQAARLARAAAKLPAGARDALAGLLAFVLFWSLRTHNFALGDSAHLIQAITYFGIRFGYRATYNEPLEILSHSVAFRAAHDALGWSAELTYAVASCLAGAAVVVLLLRFWRRTRPDPARRAAALGVTLSAGVFAIYFGSVEHYSIVGFLMLLSIVSAHGYIVRGRSILRPALAVGTAISFHVLAGWLLPPLGVAWWLRERSVGVRRMLRSALVAAAGIAVPILATVALLTALDVPLASIKDTHLGRMKFIFLLGPDYRYFQYPMLSFAHLEAALNELLLAAWPGLLALACWPLVRRRAGGDAPDRFAPYLVAVALSFQTFALVWNPDLGAANDWDLFAVVGYGDALLGAWLLTGGAVPRTAAWRAGLAITVSGLVLAGPFVIANHRARVPVDDGHQRAHMLAGADAVRRADFETAERHFREAVRLAPGDAVAHRHLGETLRRLGRREEAIGQLEISLKLAPEGPFAAKTRASLAQLRGATKRRPGP